MPTRFPQHSGGTPTPEQLFLYAARQGDADQVQRLLASVPVHHQGVDGGTALHCATVRGSSEIAKLLLARGANPDARDAKQRTPMHWAIVHEQVGMVALLLTHGADSNAQDNYGNAPLMAALGSASMLELLRLLLAHGANPLQENKAGVSPSAVTQIRGDEEAHHLLSLYADKRPR